MTLPDLGEGRRDRWLFLGSSLVLLIAVLVGLAREQRWGQPMVRFELISADATGLRPGQLVRISGMPVGQLRSLQLKPNAQVTVQVEVEQRYSNLIGPDSVARQAQEGFVGDHYLEISPDPQPAHRGHNINGHRLRYEQPMALAPLLHQLVDTQKELQATLHNTTRLTAKDLPQTLQEVRVSLGGIHKLAATLDRESAATAPELRTAMRQLRRTGTNAEQTSTQAQQFIRATQPALLGTLEDIKSLTRMSNRLLQSVLGLTGASDAPTNDQSKRP